MKRLTARAVQTLGDGKWGDGGGGLYLRVKGRRRSWVFRFQRQGRVQEMGLGAAQGAYAVPLTQARELAAAARAQLASGLNPIAERRAAAPTPTLAVMAEAFVRSKGRAWRSASYRAAWQRTIKTYAQPLLSMPVDEISANDVLGALRPIWSKLPETARRLRGSLEAVLDYARALGHIDADRSNPARWRGHLALLLPARQPHQRGHHKAMPYAEVAQFMARLREQDGDAARALSLVVLTAVRVSEALGMSWDEVQGDVWTIPAPRTKTGREHRVPLSDAALAMLVGQPREGGLVFQASRFVISRLPKKMGADCTVHGFRSCFRQWAGDETNHPREVCEEALGHAVGSAAERAYKRAQSTEKVRLLLADWADYCSMAGAG